MSRQLPTGIDGNGFPHRTHRSKKGRVKDVLYKKVGKQLKEEKLSRWDKRHDPDFVV